MKTKGKISAYIVRGSVAALLFSCVIVAISSAINLPNHPRKVPALQNNTAFGVNGHESAAPVAASATQRNGTLTFADRVAYQRAIEEVYWRHRIWPATNADPKPPLDKVMSQAEIEKKVEDYLRNSQALEDYWQRPITPDQLQAEMERIASHTKQPGVLRELFVALGNDPFVIAECLARPVLEERLITELNNDDRVKLTRIAWLKEPLRSWLAKAEAQAPVTMAAVSANYTLPKISDSRAVSECTDDTWTATNHAPINRYLHTAVWTGSEMIVWGGTDGSYLLNTGGRYNPTTDSWTDTTTTNAPTARDFHTAVWTGSEMIVWGGADFVNDLNTGGRYDPGTDSWTATSTTNAPSGRSGHTAVWTGSEMIVWGGLESTGGRYNPGTDSWIATSTTNAPSARGGHTAVWTGTEMIVWGGYDGSNEVNTGGRYNPSTDSWTATSTNNAPAARHSHTAVWSGSEMIVWGGSSGIPPPSLTSGFIEFNTGGRYNPSTDSWTATSTNNAPAHREVHTAVWSGSEMIVWGGLYFDGTTFHWVNTGGKYNPSTDSWIATSTTDAPAARQLHTAVWSGSEMIVWGGEGDSGDLNTGGRYNPSTDGWTATSTTNALSGRYLHTAVWTGSEMIVWGGVNGSGDLNTGGRYNPSTDSWIATTTTNAPTARYSHTAVWIGSEMIVWGGYNDSVGYLNTGGRYNPSTDTWTVTSTTNAPSGRYLHTAVWTGSQMIAWGGSFYDGSCHDLDTGGRYNPSTDGWTATSTTNAPTARDSHTAVWTGSKMIVWGGFSTTSDCGGGSFLNTGGRYDPGTDTWIATATTNAPAARLSHTAVWSDVEMIVWGGYNGSIFFNTGGRYNPSTDGWTTTSTNNAPAGREYHTALWSGTEMIVWGGRGQSDYGMNTGGRYNPSTDMWTATSTNNAPTGREEHTAVWTGSDMIVWGGSDASNLNTGGRYCAQFTAPSPTPTATATATATATPTATPRPTPTPRPRPTPPPRPNSLSQR